MPGGLQPAYPRPSWVLSFLTSSCSAGEAGARAGCGADSAVTRHLTAECYCAAQECWWACSPWGSACPQRWACARCGCSPGCASPSASRPWPAARVRHVRVTSPPRGCTGCPTSVCLCIPGACSLVLSPCVLSVEASDACAALLRPTAQSSAGGFHKAAHAVISQVPSSALAQLPPGLRLQLRALSQQLRPLREDLPTVADADTPEKR